MVFAVKNPATSRYSSSFQATTVPAAAVWDPGAEVGRRNGHPENFYAGHNMRTLGPSRLGTEARPAVSQSNASTENAAREEGGRGRNVALGAVFGTAVFIGTLIAGFTGTDTVSDAAVGGSYGAAASATTASVQPASVQVAR